MNDSIEIRSLQPDEWSVNRELRLRALADAPDAFGDTLEVAQQRADSEWQEFVSSITLEGGKLFIAENEKAPVGMAIVRMLTDDPDRAGLFGMWVAPTARGLGIGRALVGASVEYAKTLGVREVVLQVTEGNDKAKNLYLRAGFVDDGTRKPLRPGSQLQMAVMTKLISR